MTPQIPDDAEYEAHEVRMTFIEHLGELRWRIIYSGVALLVAVTVSYFLSDYVFEVLSKPLQNRAEDFELLPDEGIYLASYSGAMEAAWDVPFGRLLEGAQPEAFAQLADGRTVIAANRVLEGDIHEGLLAIAAPDPESDSGAVTIDTVQAHLNAELTGLQPDGDGGFQLLYRRHPGANGKADVVVRDLVVDGELTERGEVALQRDPTGSPLGAWTILTPLEPILVKLKLSVYTGLIFALPIVLWQICAFIFPGLRPREKRVIRVLVAGSSGFAILGVMVAYFIILPLILPYLLLWVPEGVNVQFQMSATVNLLIKGLIAFAAAFQLPMAVLTLVWLDIMTPQTLRDYRKVAIVGIFVASAVLTPPDPQSMLFMGVPLMLLYELSIILGQIVVMRRKKDVQNAGGA